MMIAILYAKDLVASAIRKGHLISNYLRYPRAPTATQEQARGNLQRRKNSLNDYETLPQGRDVGTRFGDRTEFAYLLEWPDETSKTAARSAFTADSEWSEIKRVTHAEHGLMVGQIEDRLLVPVEYSPAKERSLLQTA